MQQPSNRVRDAWESVNKDHDGWVKLQSGNSRKAERRKLSAYRKVERQFRGTKDKSEKEALKRLRDKIREMEKGLYTRNQRMWRRSGRILADTFRMAERGARWLYRKARPVIEKAMSNPSRKKGSAIQSHQDMVNDLQSSGKAATNAQLSTADPMVLKRRSGKRIVVRTGRGNTPKIG